jgi:hypothetical protein
MEEAVPHAQIQASLPLGEDVPLSTLQAPGTPEDERSGDFFEEVVLEELAPQSQQSRENAVPDVQALIARMRRLREQQEQEPASPDTPASAVDVPEPAGRFRRGQRVHCLPYGEGTVEQARIVAGREHLTISFAEAGAIEVDPAVNMVRVLDDPTEQAGPWDPQIF